ncbi:MAG: hypothetical protein ACP5P9_09220 [Acidimicrobiales bacterium]
MALPVATTVFVVWLAAVGALTFAEARLSGVRNGASAELKVVVASWDAHWLEAIARSGYSWNPHLRTHQTPNFLPLYPLLERAVHAVTGLWWVITELVVSLALQYAFLVVVATILVLLERPPTGPRTSRLRSLWRPSYRVLVLAAAYPASLFALQGYATSLVMVLEALAMLAFVRRRTTTAYLWAGIGCAADPSALALPVGIALAQWAASRQWSFPVQPRQLGRELLGVGGFLATMAYFGLAFDAPFAKLQAGQAWFPRRTTSQVLVNLVTFRAVRASFSTWTRAFHHARNFSYTLDAVVLVLLVVLVALVWVRSGTSWHVVVPLVGVLPLLLQSAEYGMTYGVTRLSYPLWLAMGLHPRVRRSLARRRSLFVLVLVCELAVAVVWAHYLVEQRWLD